MALTEAEGTSPIGTAQFIPAPYPSDEAERQQVVRRLLACHFDLAELDRMVAEVAALFDTPMAAVTVLDDDRQWLAARHGLEAEQTSRAVAFCGYTIAQAKPFCVPDAQCDERFAGNPLVVRDPSIRFYAGARLIVEGMPVGALCAIGQTPQSPLDEQRADALEALASSASAVLQQQLRNQGAAKGCSAAN